MKRKTLDSSVNGTSPDRIKNLVGFLLCASFMFYEFIQISIFNVIGQQIRHTLPMTQTQLGLLSAVYLYANILFVVPAGLLLDRLPFKRVITVAFAVSIIATACLALAKTYRVMLLARVVSGVAGSAFCFVGPMKFAATKFPARNMALLTGVLVAIGNVGSIFSQTPVALLTEHFGWRYAVMTYNGMGVVLLVLLYLCCPDIVPERRHRMVAGCKTLLRTVKNAQNWYAIFCAGINNLTVLLLGSIWGIPYLIAAKGWDLIQASYATSLIFVGMIAGSPLTGWATDLMQRKRPTLMAGSALSFGLLSVLVYGNAGTFWTNALFFLLGIVTACQIVVYPLLLDNNPREISGATLSLASMTIIALGAMLQPVFGRLIERTGHAHVASYPANVYLHAMNMMLILFAVGFILSLLIREPHARVKSR